jgi:hypothetical protein
MAVTKIPEPGLLLVLYCRDYKIKPVRVLFVFNGKTVFIALRLICVVTLYACR